MGTPDYNRLLFRIIVFKIVCGYVGVQPLFNILKYSFARVSHHIRMACDKISCCFHFSLRRAAFGDVDKLKLVICQNILSSYLDSISGVRHIEHIIKPLNNGEFGFPQYG